MRPMLQVIIYLPNHYRGRGVVWTHSRMSLPSHADVIGGGGEDAQFMVIGSATEFDDDDDGAAAFDVGKTSLGLFYYVIFYYYRTFVPTHTGCSTRLLKIVPQVFYCFASSGLFFIVTRWIYSDRMFFFNVFTHRLVPSFRPTYAYAMKEMYHNFRIEKCLCLLVIWKYNLMLTLCIIIIVTPPIISWRQWKARNVWMYHFQALHIFLMWVFPFYHSLCRIIYFHNDMKTPIFNRPFIPPFFEKHIQFRFNENIDYLQCVILRVKYLQSFKRKFSYANRTNRIIKSRWFIKTYGNFKLWRIYFSNTLYIKLKCDIYILRKKQSNRNSSLQYGLFQKRSRRPDEHEYVWHSIYRVQVNSGGIPFGFRDKYH